MTNPNLTIDELQFIVSPEEATLVKQIEQLQQEIRRLNEKLDKATRPKPKRAKAPTPPCTPSRDTAMRRENYKTSYGRMIQDFIDNGVPKPPWEW